MSRADEMSDFFRDIEMALIEFGSVRRDGRVWLLSDLRNVIALKEEWQHMAALSKSRNASPKRFA